MPGEWVTLQRLPVIAWGGARDFGPSAQTNPTAFQNFGLCQSGTLGIVLTPLPFTAPLVIAKS